MAQTALETIRGVLVQNLPIPAGIDGNRLALWSQRGKFSYEQIRATCGAAIQGLNEEMALVWGDLITLTADQAFWYMNGGAVQPAEITMGASRPSLVRGNNAGHMIDLKVWALGIGGTSREFEDMTEAQLVGSVVGLATAMRDVFDQAILTRFFSTSENALGTSGYDVGFCDASPNAGSGGPKYAPPRWNGTTFYEDHNHYVGMDNTLTNSATGALFNYQDLIGALALKVAEHGLPLNVDFKVYSAEADAVLIRNQSNYVMPVDNISQVDRGGLLTGNLFYQGGSVGAIPSSGGRYVGALNTPYGIGRIFVTPRIPTGYSGLYRPGPAFAANNALGVRYRPSTGFGCRITEIPDYTTTFPVKEIDVENEFGVSCGSNRYAGASGQLAASIGTTYTSPVIN